MHSPLRWPGGKSRLADTIVSYLGEHTTYVETCCGGASVFWTKPRDVSKAEILNDADGELINFYYILHKHGRRLAREVNSMPYSRKLFNCVRDDRPRYSFKRAVRFWYLNRVVFGGKRAGTFGVKASERAHVLVARLLGELDLLIERLRGVSFESVDVVRLIELYDRPTTLFFVDPPYLGVSQDYACKFAPVDHERLARALRKVKGMFLLSYNNVAAVRKLYRGSHTRRLTTRYTMGCNSASGGSSEAHELLISNRRLRRSTTDK